jgi:GcrA cell cycle regulator
MTPWPEPCKARARELFEQPITMAVCAEMINREFGTAFTEMAVKALRSRLGACRRSRGFEWTDERVAIMLAAKDEGVSQRVAAERIGGTESIVHHKCVKLGIKWAVTVKKTAPFWSDDRMAELRRLRLSQGLTTLQIAEAMGIKRGAVIAKLGRLGIKAGDAGIKKSKLARPASPYKTNRLGVANGYVALGLPATAEGLAMVDKDMALPESRRLTIGQLRNSTCRFPICGHPRDENFSYCGAPGADYAAGKPYCPGHAQISYRPSQDRKREDRHILRVTQRVSP